MLVPLSPLPMSTQLRVTIFMTWGPVWRIQPVDDETLKSCLVSHEEHEIKGVDICDHYHDWSMPTTLII